MKEKKYTQSIANAIHRFLTEDDWHFSFDEERGLFKFGLRLRGKLQKIKFFVDVKQDEYLVYAVSNFSADEDNRELMATMAEFICRANYGLVSGNFEFDMRDGEIRFKSFVDCDGITPTDEMVRNSIYCPVAMFKRYGPGIIDIIFRNASAKDAVERCENATAEQVLSLMDGPTGGADDSELEELLSGPASSNGEASAAPDSASLPIRTNPFAANGGVS